jgi:hypothetical protein
VAEDDIWKQLRDLADEWEQKGWLDRSRDQHGREIWQLAPLGRKEFGLPLLRSQEQ